MANEKLTDVESVTKAIATEFVSLSLEQKKKLAVDSGLLDIVKDESAILNTAIGNFMLARVFESKRCLETIADIHKVIRIVPNIVRYPVGAISEPLTPTQPKSPTQSRVVSQSAYNLDNAQELVKKSEPIKNEAVSILSEIMGEIDSMGDGLPTFKKPIVTATQIQPTETPIEMFGAEKVIESDVANVELNTQVPQHYNEASPQQVVEEAYIDPFDNLMEVTAVKPIEGMHMASGAYTPIGQLTPPNFGSKGEALKPEIFNADPIQVIQESQENDPLKVNQVDMFEDAEELPNTQGMASALAQAMPTLKTDADIDINPVKPLRPITPRPVARTRRK